MNKRLLGGGGEERSFGPGCTGSGSMIRFNPRQQSSSGFRWEGGHVNPQPVPGTDGYQFRVVNKGRSKGPLLYSCGHQQPFCVKARWQKESLGQYCAAKAEGEGLRHGKHSSVPFAAAMEIRYKLKLFFSFSKTDKGARDHRTGEHRWLVRKDRLGLHGMKKSGWGDKKNPISSVLHKSGAPPSTP